MRPKGSIALQGSRVMNSPGILSGTAPVHISDGWHWKAWSFVWIFYSCSRGPGSGLVVAPAGKPQSWALSLTVSSVVSSSSFLCLSLNLYNDNTLPFRTPVLLHLLRSWLICECWSLDVFLLFPKMVADMIAPKLSMTFRRLISL